MKKDIGIAITVGFILGAFAAIFFINLPSILSMVNRKSSTESTLLISPTQSPQNAVQSVSIEINSPQNGSLSETKNIKISGKTQASNTVVIETDLDTEAVEASTDGSFLFGINLTEGISNIFLTAYNQFGESDTKSLSVFYTGEKL